MRSNYELGVKYNEVECAKALETIEIT